MKEILIIHTGGTIGCESNKEHRKMRSDTVKKAKRLLIDNFEKSSSQYACFADLLADANFDEEKTTLSESMYPEKLCEIISHLNSFDFEKYAGVIVLHGTDTLAFSAALFSFIYCNIKVPMIFVSGNRPPDDKASNANVNFKTAVELIWQGISPNVYAVYRNSDGIVRLYLASTLMQCPNFSEDFVAAWNKNVFEMRNSHEKSLFEECGGDVFKKCKALCDSRNVTEENNAVKSFAFKNKILLIRPFTGLDYCVYLSCLENANSEYLGVVHGTYHSGTVSLPGFVYNNTDEMYSSYSVLCLLEMCKKRNLPLYIAPSTLGSEQYETMTVVNSQSGAVLLNMTTEAAYAKLMVALNCGLYGEKLEKYMKTNIANEMLD